MRGITRSSLKRMCCIGGIGISTKNETCSENDFKQNNIPNKFYDAWDYNDDNEKMKWRKAIKKEIDNMNRREVWTPVKKLPDNTKSIGLKWVFNIKSSGDYKARLVALGCNQIPGKDFKESNSPVLHEVTMRLMILYYIMNKKDGG